MSCSDLGLSVIQNRMSEMYIEQQVEGIYTFVMAVLKSKHSGELASKTQYICYDL